MKKEIEACLCVFANSGASKQGMDQRDRKYFECGQSGHMRAFSPELMRGGRGHVQGWYAMGKKNASTVSKDASHTVKVQMTIDEWEKWCKFREVNTCDNTSHMANHEKNHTSSEWLIDSGASRHMAGSHKKFSMYVPDVKRQSVKLADGSTQAVMGRGTVVCGSNMSLSSVLHVPSFPINLLSISCITKELNCAAIFYPTWCLFEEIGTGRELGRGSMREGLYYLDKNISPMVAAALSYSPLQEFMLLHRRLGHMPLSTLGKLYPSLFNKIDKEKLVCDASEYGKHTRSSYLLSDNRSTEPFQTIHSDVWGDVWGPSGVSSINGYRSFVTFIDCCTRVTWVYVLRSKVDVFECFRDFHNMIKNQYNACLKIFRTDNGTEYVNKEFDEYLSNLGVIHQTTCPGTSQQNGLAERKNRHLLEVTRYLMIAMNVPKFLWSDALMTAAYLINRMPSRVLGYKTPIECLTGETTYVVPPRVFGCVCFVRDHRPSVGKLDPRVVKCVFVGYSGKQKGYKCWCPSERRMFVSMDVTFRENEPFYGEPTDLTDLFPDDSQDGDEHCETGGDDSRVDSDAISQKMIVGVIPEDVHDDVGVMDVGQEQVQGEQQDEPNEAMRWSKPNEERDPQVYTRRHKVGEKQAQGEELLTSGHDSESQVQVDSHDSTSHEGNDDEEIGCLKKTLAKSFEVKDLGYLHYFLGIEVAYGAQGSWLESDGSGSYSDGVVGCQF